MKIASVEDFVWAVLLALAITAVCDAGVVEDAHSHGVRKLITPSPDEPGMMSTGSVVFISPNRAVTAEHIPFNQQSYVKTSGKKNQVRLIYEPFRDGIDQVRFISVSGGPYEFVNVGNRPQIGDRVFTYGFPGGAPYRSEGKVTTNVGVDLHAFEYPPEMMIVCDFPIGSGNSGGGLFNESGELIGIASSTSETQSYWIGTEVIEVAIRPTPQQLEVIRSRSPRLSPGRSELSQQKYQRVDSKQRVVVFTLPDKQCPPCDKFKADDKAGKFPGFEFEYVTYYPDLAKWDKPELHEAFRKECRPKESSLGTPVLWFPGTGKYRQGYDTSQGLLVWLRDALRFVMAPILGRPPSNRVPTIASPVAPVAPDDVYGVAKGIPDQLREIGTEASEALQIARGLKDAGLIEKVKLLGEAKSKTANLSEDVEQLKSSVATISEGREELKKLAIEKAKEAAKDYAISKAKEVAKAKAAEKADEAKSKLWQLAYGIIGGLFSGPLEALGLKERLV